MRKSGKFSGYTFWSTDFHIAPIADVRNLFEHFCQVGE
jgi:hypothetical protein